MTNLAESSAILQRKYSEKNIIVTELNKSVSAKDSGVLGELKLSIENIAPEGSYENSVFEFCDKSSNIPSSKIKGLDGQVSLNMLHETTSIIVQYNNDVISCAGNMEIKDFADDEVRSIMVDLISEHGASVSVTFQVTFYPITEIINDKKLELSRIEQEISAAEIQVREASKHVNESAKKPKDKHANSASKKKKNKSSGNIQNPAGKENIPKDSAVVKSLVSYGAAAWNVAVAGSFMVYNTRGYFAFVIVSSAIYYYGETLSV